MPISDFRQYDGLVLYRKAFELLKKDKKRLYDDYFPPTTASLVPNSNVMKQNPSWEQLKWVRIGDLYAKKKMLLSESTPNDI